MVRRGMVVFGAALALVAVGCSRSRSILLLERMDGTLSIGGGPLAPERCRRELPGLLGALATDRSNYGQRAADARTWITRGYCVGVGGP